MVKPDLRSSTAVTGAQRRFALAGCFYLGLAAALPRLDPGLWLISAALVVALILGAFGWRGARSLPGGRLYWIPAVMFAVVAGVSGIAAWDPNATYTAVTMGTWLLVITPGLVRLLREPENRRVLLVGLAIGTAVYGLVAVWRMITGEPVLDRGVTDELRKTIFGLNRNAVNIRAAIVMPFLLWWLNSKRTSLVRWLIAGSVGAAVLATGGRAGIAAVGSGLLLFALLRPGLGRRIQAALIVGILGLAVFSGVRAMGGELGSGLDRLTGYVLGERTSSDEARELLSRKAWAVAYENPVWGVGLGNFQGTDHPIDEEASRPRVREIVEKGVAHNTYAQVFAELGYIGGGAYVLILLGAFHAGVRLSRHRDVRTVTSGLGGLMVALLFDSSIGGAGVFLAIALVLAAAISASKSHATSEG